MNKFSEVLSVLLFDLDDTLIRTRDHYCEAFECFVDLMESLGFSRSEITPVFDRVEMKNNKSMGVSPARYPGPVNSKPAGEQVELNQVWQKKYHSFPPGKKKPPYTTGWEKPTHIT